MAEMTKAMAKTVKNLILRAKKFATTKYRTWRKEARERQTTTKFEGYLKLFREMTMRLMNWAMTIMIPFALIGALTELIGLKGGWLMKILGSVALMGPFIGMGFIVFIVPTWIVEKEASLREGWKRNATVLVLVALTAISLKIASELTGKALYEDIQQNFVSYIGMIWVVAMLGFGLACAVVEVFQWLARNCVPSKSSEQE